MHPFKIKHEQGKFTHFCKIQDYVSATVLAANVRQTSLSLAEISMCVPNCIKIREDARKFAQYLRELTWNDSLMR